MFSFMLFILALVGAGLQVRLGRYPRNSRQKKAEILLLWLLVVSVGLNGVIGFFGHVFAADQIADYIGWPQNTPYQGEVGFANLALGVLGLLCLRLGGGFWLATGIAASIFNLGAAIVHVKAAVAAQFIRPGDAGALLPQIMIPVLLLALLTVQAKLRAAERDPWLSPARRT